jgi:hypothetical protein
MDLYLKPRLSFSFSSGQHAEHTADQLPSARMALDGSFELFLILDSGDPQQLFLMSLTKTIGPVIHNDPPLALLTISTTDFNSPFSAGRDWFMFRFCFYEIPSKPIEEVLILFIPILCGLSV